MTEMKRCPFCGGKADVIALHNSPHEVWKPTDWFVACRDCGAGTMRFFKRPNEAREAWNRRAETKNP